MPGSAHGVRKLAATRMANNGATEAQLMAVFGWTDPKMAAHYTHIAKQEALGRSINRHVERERNIYPRTWVSGAGERTESEMKSTSNFENGGPGRARTSNQTVMSRRL